MDLRKIFLTTLMTYQRRTI